MRLRKAIIADANLRCGDCSGGVEERAIAPQHEPATHCTLAFAAALVVAAPGWAKERPTACQSTTIMALEPRLQGVPDSGSAVAYANGVRQTSYDIVPALQHAQVGDRVKLCVVERPKNCPPGDNRGRSMPPPTCAPPSGGASTTHSTAAAAPDWLAVAGLDLRRQTSAP